jgi:hypothetical protein
LLQSTDTVRQWYHGVHVVKLIEIEAIYLECAEAHLTVRAKGLGPTVDRELVAVSKVAPFRRDERSLSGDALQRSCDYFFRVGLNSNPRIGKGRVNKVYTDVNSGTHGGD